MKTTRFLVLGFGDPGALDEGLGPACAAAIEQLPLEDVEIEADCRLRLEDAWRVARHRVVIFVDASLSGPAPWSLEELRPCPPPESCPSLVDPVSLLAIAQRDYGARTRGFRLAIRGYEFGGCEGRLSSGARIHLEDAVRFLTEVIDSGDLELLESQTSPV